MKYDPFFQAWHVPKYGFVLDTFLAQRQFNNVELGDIVVRAAVSREDATRGLSVAEVTRMMEDRFRKEELENPFSTLTFTGLSQARFEAEALVDAWNQEHCQKLEGIPNTCMLADENTGLFRMFASLEPSPEGIMEFARCYSDVMSRPLLVWYEEILEMQRAVYILDLLQKKDATRLGKHFRVLRPDEKWGFQEPPGTTNNRWYHHVYDSHPELSWGKQPAFPRRRLIEPIMSYPLPMEKRPAGPSCETDQNERLRFARSHVARMIDTHFDKYVASRLVWSKEKTLRRIFTSESLLGVVWLQFEQSVTGEKEYRICRRSGCGKWFEISPGAGRSDKKYCSDVCRVRAYQKRRKKT